MTALRVRLAQAGDAAAIGRVHVAVWRETYAGIMPAEYLAALSEERRAAMWRTTIDGERAGDTAVFVADDPVHGVVGFAMAGPMRSTCLGFDGEFWAINIRTSHHRRGFGRALILSAARWFIECERHGAMLWVIEANPARGFYERLGAEQLDLVQRAQFESVTLSEIAYGWRSLPDLLGRLMAGTR